MLIIRIRKISNNVNTPQGTRRRKKKKMKEEDKEEEREEIKSQVSKSRKMTKFRVKINEIETRKK